MGQESYGSNGLEGGQSRPPLAELKTMAVDAMLSNAAIFEAQAELSPTLLQPALAKVDAPDFSFESFLDSSSGAGCPEMEAFERACRRFSKKGFRSLERAMDYNSLPPELKAYFLPHVKFATHDYGAIGQSLDSIQVYPHLQDAQDKELLKSWLQAYARLPLHLQYAFEGMATLFMEESEIPIERVDVAEVVSDAINIVWFRNFFHAVGPNTRGARPSDFAYDGTELRDKLQLINKIGKGFVVEGNQGVVRLTIYNFLKNTAAIAWDLLRNLDAEEQQVPAHMKAASERWIEHLNGAPLTITAEMTETQDAYILHLHDNGLGLDFTQIKFALTRMVERYGLETILENGWVAAELAQPLRQWGVSPYVFNKAVAPHLADFTRIATLSGSYSGGEHSGTGVWAAEKMLQSTKASFVIGQGINGGTYFATIFPKRMGSDSEDLVSRTREQLESGALGIAA